MVVNLIKYNVDGDWLFRLEESKKYRKDGFSLESCKLRYGEIIGTKLYEDRRKSIITKRENYTDITWKELCNKKISNLGLNGYINKYGKELGEKNYA